MELIQGKYYYAEHSIDNYVIFQASAHGTGCAEGVRYKSEYYKNNSWAIKKETLRFATEKEIEWLCECRQAGKYIEPSQLLGETECHKFKIGDIVRRKKGSGPNNMIGELTPFTIEGFRSDGWIIHDMGYHRPDYLEIVPQEEVEYWECIKDPWPYKILGLTCKIKDKKAQSVICNVNGTHEAGTQLFVSLDLIHFKPSTREAYEAQQKGKATGNEDINDFIYPTEKVNKCSTINTNKNGKNESCETKSTLDRNTGAKTGQSIRLRTTGVRIKCKSGLLRSGKKVTRTVKSSPRPKAEIGRRFTKGRS